MRRAAGLMAVAAALTFATAGTASAAVLEVETDDSGDKTLRYFASDQVRNMANELELTREVTRPVWPELTD